MSKMKRFIEAVSVDMGFDGMINTEVLEEASRRLQDDEQRALFISKAEMLYLEYQLLNKAKDDEK